MRAFLGEVLEDIVLSGVKQAADKAKQLAADEMGKITGGMGGGMGIPGLG